MPAHVDALLAVAGRRQRFDTTIPANRAEMAAVEQLADVADAAGLTMIQLALGFVTAHPGVTSAIIGPRTIDHLHSQLAAAEYPDNPRGISQRRAAGRPPAGNTIARKREQCS
ncbi:aldo/keto reductase [Nocardia sp. NPDC051990]|uniref:aldo/keto reductase n=1 Tax=Nocardia sp. NPDC051990 TaxID=3155285 RepID=UPI0034268D56